MQNNARGSFQYVKNLLPIGICLVFCAVGFFLSINLGSWEVPTADIFKIIINKIFWLEWDFSDPVEKSHSSQKILFIIILNISAVGTSHDPKFMDKKNL